MNRPGSILIAESGATKTSWLLGINGQEKGSVQTKGSNPNVSSQEELMDNVHQLHSELLEGFAPEHIYFYGSGLRHQTAKEKIHSLLIQSFPKSHIEIEDDLKAVIRACGREEGWVAILGTGSSACRYKNETVLQVCGGHGYLFGDEGSGTDLGKHLLKKWLQGDFSSEISDALSEIFQATALELRQIIYCSSSPNLRLAAICPTLSQLIDSPEIQELVLPTLFSIFYRDP